MALFIATQTRTAAAQVEGRNCPVVEDQLVIVDPIRPTPFRLRVADLGEGQISIFQFPLRGTLQPTGPTPLDFVFVPAADFDGTTTFTFRLVPPPGCPRSVQLGRVTLAGGQAAGTATGLAPAMNPTLCGIGLFGPLLLAAAFTTLLGTARFRRRR